jgi:hypothetical protein
VSQPIRYILFFTDYGIETFLKKLVGRADIEDAVQRLDTLTKEEGLMTAARNLAVTHHVDDNVTTIKDVVTATKDSTQCSPTFSRSLVPTHPFPILLYNSDGRATAFVTLWRCHPFLSGLKYSTGNQSREKLRTWLSPPNPSINHNVACNTHHEGTAMWFTQSRTFDEWKKNGSLLWIRGNCAHRTLSFIMVANIFSGFTAGSGKSILWYAFRQLPQRWVLISLISSTIIEDIKDLRETKSALVAFYYFDFKDAAKRHLRGLLSSLLMQLGGDSLGCWDVLHQLYTKCRDGSEQPSEAALAGCLKNILDVPGQVPIYIVIDALDECPDTTGTPSDRNKVLDFVDDLVGGKHSTLYMCISSRPEQDIQSTLDPLTPTSRRVSLHEEGGQKEDINSYIRYFVHSSKTMQGWSAQDRELVIDTLMKNAGGT